MATPIRNSRPGTYFITSITWNRRHLFQTTAASDLLLDTLQHYRREDHYKLHAFVAMPDHIYLLLTPQTIPLERAVMLIKGGFSHRLANKFLVWQKGFADHRIRTRERLRSPPRIHPPQPRPRPPLPTSRGLPLLLRLSPANLRA